MVLIPDILRANELKPKQYKPRYSPPAPTLHSDIIPVIERSTDGIRRNIPKDGIRDQEIFRKHMPEDEVIVDPLAFYVPYHSHPDIWGVYFRLENMIQDFSRFINNYCAYIMTDYYIHIASLIDGIRESWYFYVMMVFWHELTHHVIEDISTLREGFTANHYPIMPRNIEEGLCEYYAFTTAKKKLVAPHGGSRGVEKLMHLRRPAPKPSVRTKMLDCLYTHWNRENDPAYKPRIESAASSVLGVLWNPLWDTHKNGGKVLVVQGDDIYGKFYVTML